jgi:uncharacterized membrane protein YebE (DUF533 family)
MAENTSFLDDFDPRAVLEQLLNTSKQYAEKGQAIAEEQLNIPESGQEREVMLDGLKKGALASAVLLGLLGTSGGRSLTKTAIKVGGLAALGTAAYKGYQNWQRTGDVMDSGNVAKQAEMPIHELSKGDSESRGLLLIEAMVAAANADGRIDSHEQQAIKHQILEMHLPGEMAMVLENIIDLPITAGELAQKVTNRAEAAEVYVATRLLIGTEATGQEKQFLETLVSSLSMAPELVNSLEAEIA